MSFVSMSLTTLGPMVVAPPNAHAGGLAQRLRLFRSLLTRARLTF